MDSVFAVGMVAGGVALGIWGGFKKKIVTGMMGVAGIGLGILIVGLAPATMFWLAVTGMALGGFMSPIANGSLGAILQAEVKPEFQGRVMGVLASLATLMTPIGLLIAGPVSDEVGIRAWYWVAGLVSLLMGAGSFLVPVIMNVESQRNGKGEAKQEPTAAQVASAD
jgi:DHA3 family macrolide efflux protein-like MFS transporter